MDVTVHNVWLWTMVVSPPLTVTIRAGNESGGSPPIDSIVLNPDDIVLGDNDIVVLPYDISPPDDGGGGGGIPIDLLPNNLIFPDGTVPPDQIVFPTKKKYSCRGKECVEDSSGIYTSSDCSGKCKGGGGGGNGGNGGGDNGGRGFKLALWHEGVVGDVAKDPAAFKRYMAEGIKFVKDKKFDVMFCNVITPVHSKSMTAQSLADAFLNPLPSNVEAGVVAYIREKDSDWLMVGVPGHTNLEKCISFLGVVNKLSTGQKITRFAFDGEDSGDNSSREMMAHALDWAKTYAPDIVDIGYAKGPSVTPSATGGTSGYPEIYWVGELKESGCTGKFEEPGCTTDSWYYKNRNKPQVGLDRFSKAADDYPFNTSIAEKGTWPMFSIENLSQTAPATDCIASRYAGADMKKQVCGTFDGFSYWDWDKFEEFLTLFAKKYNLTGIAVYELQFLPPHWLN